MGGQLSEWVDNCRVDNSQNVRTIVRMGGNSQNWWTIVRMGEHLSESVDNGRIEWKWSDWVNNVRIGDKCSDCVGNCHSQSMNASGQLCYLTCIFYFNLIDQ
jgi:hypothetical protein